MAIWPFDKSRGKKITGPIPDNPPDSHCSFCGRPHSTVGPMVEGPNNIFICVECVRLAYEIAEGNRMGSPAVSDLSDPTIQRSAHMHIRCYFLLERISSELWRAVSSIPKGFSGEGHSPREAVKAMQKALLSAATPALDTETGPAHWFTNHAEQRLR
jgi:hypothetical protein